MKKRYPKLLGTALLMFMLSMNGLQAQVAGPFVSPYELPPLLDQQVYDLTMDRETHNFNDSGNGNLGLNIPMNTFAFNYAGSSSNSYLGPTMVWTKGTQITLNIENRLNIPQGTSTGPYNPPTTVHLHGAHVPAWVDGGPHGVIESGATRSVNFTVLDDACTLWYHPHGEDETYTQVEMGLAGMIIVDDPLDALNPILPHTYGVDDLPIIMQDHVFQKLNSGAFAGNIDTARAQAARTVIVNGTRFPTRDVPAQNVRLRILDGSSRLAYQLGIGIKVNDSTYTPLPFKMIASDGGYLPDSARTMTTFLTGVGIRNEIVFDFTGYEGQDLYLLNMNSSILNLPIIVSNKEQDKALAWMQFHVVPAVNSSFFVPAVFPPHTIYPFNPSTDTTRVKQLIGNGAPNPVGFSINNNQYEYDVVNDVVREGSIEKWTIQNNSGIAHPFHIHDIQFYVTEVRNGSTVIPTPIEFLGRKDDILVQVGWSVDFVTQFSDFGRPKPFLPSTLDSAAYMYHCHILTHEDGYYAPGTGNGTPGSGNGSGGNTVAGRVGHGMMQQFVVWDGLFTEQDAQALTDDMVLYPNPASNQLNLKGESSKASKIRVIDLEGRTLIAQDLKAFNGSTSIDISTLPAGMVLVEWQSAKGTFTKKVVIR